MLKEGKFQTKCLPNGTWSHPIPKCWSEYCSCFTKQTTALLLLYCNSGCDIGRASDLRFTGRGFESWLGTFA